ncbi:MAG: DUF3575 domain-containing protein [Bacteroidales bacterium]|nr:DUF3575 domain-containing protein [Bacteroidales bacterium]
MSFLLLSSNPTFSLFFRWDKAEHDDEYILNKGALSRFIATVKQIDPQKIERVDAVAWSSPDGVYEHNVKLSRDRARYTRDLLSERLPELKDRISVHEGGEAWGLLRARITADQRLTERSRLRVLRFLDEPSISDDTRKWRLANWLGNDDNVGEIYPYLLRTHYRYLRNCVVVVVRLKENDEDTAATAAAEAGSGEGGFNGAKALAEAEAAARAAEAAAAQKAEEEAKAAAQKAAAEAEAAAAQKAAEEAAAEAEAARAAAEQAGRQRRPGRPVLALSTNLPYDITYIPGYGATSIPSVSLEYYPARYGRISVGADLECPMWVHADEHRYMQINNLTLNGRYYFSPKYNGDFRGPYALVSLGAARYAIGWDEKGWEGEGVSASAGIGYKRSFRRGGRLFWDAGLALGWFHTLYDPYVWGDDTTLRYYYDYSGLPENFRERNHSLDWFGPTRVWFSIGIDLFNRKIR